MFTVEDVKEKINEFITESSKVTVALVAILIFLFLSGTIALIVTSSSSKKITTINLPPEKFNATEYFFEPEPLTLTEDYYFSRISPDKWSEEERDRWFTMPNEDNLQELGNANNKLIDKITGAAP